MRQTASRRVGEKPCSEEEAVFAHNNWGGSERGACRVKRSHNLVQGAHPAEHLVGGKKVQRGEKKKEKAANHAKTTFATRSKTGPGKGDPG